MRIKLKRRVLVERSAIKRGGNSCSRPVDITTIVDELIKEDTKMQGGGTSDGDKFAKISNVPSFITRLSLRNVFGSNKSNTNPFLQQIEKGMTPLEFTKALLEIPDSPIARMTAYILIASSRDVNDYSVSAVMPSIFGDYDKETYLKFTDMIPNNYKLTKTFQATLLLMVTYGFYYAFNIYPTLPSSVSSSIQRICTYGMKKGKVEDAKNIATMMQSVNMFVAQSCSSSPLSPNDQITKMHEIFVAIDQSLVAYVARQVYNKVIPAYTEEFETILRMLTDAHNKLQWFGFAEDRNDPRPRNKYSHPSLEERLRYLKEEEHYKRLVTSPVFKYVVDNMFDKNSMLVARLNQLEKKDNWSTGMTYLYKNHDIIKTYIDKVHKALKDAEYNVYHDEHEVMFRIQVAAAKDISVKKMDAMTRELMKGKFPDLSMCNNDVDVVTGKRFCKDNVMDDDCLPSYQTIKQKDNRCFSLGQYHISDYNFNTEDKEQITSRKALRYDPNEPVYNAVERF